MNLHGIVRSAIGVVNPEVTATLMRNSGVAKKADGSRYPSYQNLGSIKVQLQALTYGDVQQIDGLNIQGARRAIYCDGTVFGLIRVKRTGGDLLVFPDGLLPEGNAWQCVHVLEQWPDWVKFVVTLQNEG